MNFKNLALAATLLAFFATPLAAQTPTFHEDIAPIIYENCTECHMEGGIGPMQFISYEEVSQQGSFIEYIIQDGSMPPWTPDHTYTTLQGERYLTDDEIALISEWVQGGMLEGDASNNPGLPDYNAENGLGEPDLVLTMPEPYIHGGDGIEQYQVFVLPTGLTDYQEIRAVEVVPGNTAIAHHALVGYIVGGSSITQAQYLDEQTEEPGYESFGSYTVDVDDFLFGGWVPGSEPFVFEGNVGKVMDPGSCILIQMHYGATYTDQLDQTSINIYFADDPVERLVETKLMGPASLTEPFYIFAEEIYEFHGMWEVPEDISIISTLPHSHYLGESWKVFATSPDNLDTIPIIHIPDWDFHWQGVFTFEEMVHVPEGYTIHGFAAYDNTSSNPDNPHNPPIDMGWGDLTTQEMYVLFIQYVEYAEDSVGDVLPSDTDKLYPAWPNPATSDVQFGFYLAHSGEQVTLELFDLQGKKIKTLVDGVSYDRGRTVVGCNVEGVANGNYIVKMTTGSGTTMSKNLQVHN